LSNYGRILFRGRLFFVFFFPPIFPVWISPSIARHDLTMPKCLPETSSGFFPFFVSTSLEECCNQLPFLSGTTATEAIRAHPAEDRINVVQAAPSPEDCLLCISWRGPVANCPSASRGSPSLPPSMGSPSARPPCVFFFRAALN